MSQTKKTDSKETVSEPKKTVSANSKSTSVSKSNNTKPKKKDGRGGNHGGHLKSPVIGMNGFNLKPGDNSKYIAFNMQIMNLPDINMDDVHDVSNRINEYLYLCFENDMKPTVSGMAMSLNGMSRQQLWSIATNQVQNATTKKVNVAPDIMNAIKKGYNFMQNLWEEYMQNGKINPVAGIFLGKNNYGYVDKQEHVLTPAAGDSSEYNSDEIKARYKEIESHD